LISELPQDLKQLYPAAQPVPGTKLLFIVSYVTNSQVLENAF
jgi:hypothetical protein